LSFERYPMLQPLGNKRTNALWHQHIYGLFYYQSLMYSCHHSPSFAIYKFCGAQDVSAISQDQPALTSRYIWSAQLSIVQVYHHSPALSLDSSQKQHCLGGCSPFPVQVMCSLPIHFCHFRFTLPTHLVASELTRKRCLSDIFFLQCAADGLVVEGLNASIDWMVRPSEFNSASTCCFLCKKFGAQSLSRFNIAFPAFRLSLLLRRARAQKPKPAWNYRKRTLQRHVVKSSCLGICRCFASLHQCRRT
jgi:hypothetical protein